MWENLSVGIQHCSLTHEQSVNKNIQKEKSVVGFKEGRKPKSLHKSYKLKAAGSPYKRNRST